MTARKKLIEVALPLDAISRAAAYEKMPGIGSHPRGLHQWWARRPLGVCRAVIFASLVDDTEQPECPSQLLDAIDRLLPDSARQRTRRERLFEFLTEMVKWQNSGNEHVLSIARELIRASTGGNPPPILDPFCGAGSIPLEAQRLGLEAYASDLNPVAVLITKALIEIPSKFVGRAPVNPDAGKQIGQGVTWKGAMGLAADVRWYGQWMRDRALERIGHLYPKEPGGQTVIGWLWARTVKCPNPACGTRMPLALSFWLSTKKNREVWAEPIVDTATECVQFEVGTGKQPMPAQVDVGSGLRNDRGKRVKSTFRCLVCREGIAKGDYINGEAERGALGTVPLAKVVGGARTRIYVPFSPPEADGLDAKVAPYFSDSELLARMPSEECKGTFASNAQGRQYGFKTFSDYFTRRQLVALMTFSDLVGEARNLVVTHTGGDREYADAIATYLAFALDRTVDFNSSLCRWVPSNEKVMNTFGRQALPMVWDFAEANVLGDSVGSWLTCLGYVADCLSTITPGADGTGRAEQLDAASALPAAPRSVAIVTDPPYYSNVSYADLSDFFYVWLRRMLGSTYPDLFSTLLTPKSQELVATRYRFGGDRRLAEQHFRQGLSKTFALIVLASDSEYPITFYYAFKQAEESDAGNGATAAASTGWQTMLQGLLSSGLQVVGTWPMRTEQEYRNVAMGANALASSIVLVCRPRRVEAPIATRREFYQKLREELPEALGHLMGGHIAPVDLAQATIGPGMAVFSRYSKVLEASGDAMSVRTALQIINQAIEDYFTEREGELDADTQFCTRWFEQHGLSEGPFGDAETLAKAKNIGIDAMARNGVLAARAGKVRLQPLAYYLEGAEVYDPVADQRPTVWEACHYLIAALDSGGEAAAARLARRLGGLAERARDLAYRLYDICDRKGWAEPALGYNALVSSWPEIQREAARLAVETQAELI